MSTYATTFELYLGEQSTTIAVNRNLLDTVDGDAVRLNLEGRHGSAYLTREEAVALALAILEAANPDLTAQLSLLGTAYVRAERAHDGSHTATVLDTTTVIERRNPVTRAPR